VSDYDIRVESGADNDQSNSANNFVTNGSLRVNIDHLNASSEQNTCRFIAQSLQIGFVTSLSFTWGSATRQWR
jgi:hypothetical protein